MLVNEAFPDEGSLYATKGFWEEIHDSLKLIVGTRQLSKRWVDSARLDVLYFLPECSSEHFLEFIEEIFRTHKYQQGDLFRNSQGNHHLIGDINNLFLADSLPYMLTDFVWETRRELFHGSEVDASVIVAYPQVVRREDAVTHVWAVEPTLILLRDKSFTSANKEFLEALDAYGKGDYGNCLTNCGSSFESTMKIICDRKNWPYKQTEVASQLLKHIFNNSTLDQNIFDQPLTNIATLRNKLSKSHGAGVQQKTVPQHIAKYAINATAAAILLIVEECL